MAEFTTGRPFRTLAWLAIAPLLASLLLSPWQTGLLAGWTVLLGLSIALGGVGLAGPVPSRLGVLALLAGVHGPGPAQHIYGFPVGEHRDFQDRDDLRTTAPCQRQHGPVKLRAQQIAGHASIVLSWLGAPGHRRVVLVDPYGGTGLGARALGEPGVVGVRVGVLHLSRKPTPSFTRYLYRCGAGSGMQHSAGWPQPLAAEPGGGGR